MKVTSDKASVCSSGCQRKFFRTATGLANAWPPGHAKLAFLVVVSLEEVKHMYECHRGTCEKHSVCRYHAIHVNSQPPRLPQGQRFFEWL